MGIYFNSDNNGFFKDSHSNIYIDKTGLLKELNKLIYTSDCCVALSHARRFGKSQAARMIDAYYSMGSNSRELFAPFEIAQDPDFEKHLNKYNVIHIDISSFLDDYKDNLVDKLKEYIIDDIRKIHPELNFNKKISDICMQVYKASGKPFVIILDEWDCVIREYGGDSEKAHQYMQFLHSLFKSEESALYLALAYITGILPIKKIKNESALNNFKEFTMINSRKLTPYFGFTEEEVKVLCADRGMEFDSVKEWYNGYLINGQHMYNPWALNYKCFNHNPD